MSVPLSRRSFLSGLSALSAARLTNTALPGAGAVAVALTPTEAAAVEPATMIALASAVIGAISSMNASDGGAGALAQASYERLGIIIEKLEGIQRQLGDIIIAINNIDEVTAQQLAAAEQQRFHTDLRTDIEAFRDLYGKWDQRMTQKQWLESSRAAPELQNIRNIISRNTSRARAAQRFDATTGMIESIYAFLDLAVAAMIGYTAYERARTAEIHIRWIDRIIDFDQPESAAASLKKDSEDHDALMAQIWAGPVLRNYDPETGTGIHSCVGLNNYRPALPALPMMGRPDVIPEVNGPHTRMHRKYSLKEIEAVEAQQPLGYKIYDLDTGNVQRGNSPLPCNWQVVTMYMPVLRDRLRYMRNMNHFTRAERQIEDLVLAVAKINLLRARMAYSSAAISAVLGTKERLEEEVRGFADEPSFLMIGGANEALQ